MFNIQVIASIVCVPIILRAYAKTFITIVLPILSRSRVFLSSPIIYKWDKWDLVKLSDVPRLKILRKVLQSMPTNLKFYVFFFSKHSIVNLSAGKTIYTLPWRQHEVAKIRVNSNSEKKISKTNFISFSKLEIRIQMIVLSFGLAQLGNQQETYWLGYQINHRGVECHSWETWSI